jgi:hypothetical protein
MAILSISSSSSLQKRKEKGLSVFLGRNEKRQNRMEDILERTLALVKPELVLAGRSAEVAQLAELYGFTIIVSQKFQVIYQPP